MWKHASLNVVALGFGITIGFLHPARAETLEPNVPLQLAQASPSSSTLDSERVSIQKALSDYADAFSRSAAEAATFYGEPTLLVLPNQVKVLSKRADVEDLFAKTLAGLTPLGYSYSKFVDPRIRLLNATTAICSAVAVRFKADGTEMQRLGVTYLLHKDNSDWKIHELIPTDLDKLVSTD
jgi:ketosteroid isomerase-like protein